jgi:hypothetical protein
VSKPVALILLSAFERTTTALGRLGGADVDVPEEGGVGD